MVHTNDTVVWHVLWHIRLNLWLWIKGLQVRILSMPGSFVLQQDTLSTLLLSTQVYKWVPGRMRMLFVAWCGMCVPLSGAGQNAPQGVEKVHQECKIDIESSDSG